MVNDQLVLDIKNGDKSKLPELWYSVKGWAFKVANRFYVSKQPYCDAKGFTADDLCQCGYFAMLDALKTYKAESGRNFITWYTYYLTRQYFKEIHLFPGEPNHQANFDVNLKSLNDDISSEGDETELIDLIPDNHDYIAEIDDKIESESLHKMLDDFMNDILDDMEKEIIRKNFWQDKSKEQIAKECSSTDRLIYAKEHRALQKLRGNLVYDKKGNIMSRQKLLNYLEQCDPTVHMSRERLIREHSSIPEQIVLKKESFNML